MELVTFAIGTLACTAVSFCVAVALNSNFDCLLKGRLTPYLCAIVAVLVGVGMLALYPGFGGAPLGGSIASVAVFVFLQRERRKYPL